MPEVKQSIEESLLQVVEDWDEILPNEVKEYLRDAARDLLDKLVSDPSNVETRELLRKALSGLEHDEFLRLISPEMVERFK